MGAIGIRMMMLGERLYANEASKNQSGAFDNWVRPYKKMVVKIPMTKRIEIFCSAQEKWLNIYVGIEEKWRKVRLWLFVFSGVAGLAFLYQTRVVYYPFYLILALNNGRSVGVKVMSGAPPQKREIYLRLLYEVYIRYQDGQPPVHRTLDPELQPN